MEMGLIVRGPSTFHVYIHFIPISLDHERKIQLIHIPCGGGGHFKLWQNGIGLRMLNCKRERNKNCNGAILRAVPALSFLPRQQYFSCYAGGLFRAPPVVFFTRRRRYPLPFAGAPFRTVLAVFFAPRWRFLWRCADKRSDDHVGGRAGTARKRAKAMGKE